LAFLDFVAVKLVQVGSFNNANKFILWSHQLVWLQFSSFGLLLALSGIKTI